MLACDGMAKLCLSCRAGLSQIDDGDSLSVGLRADSRVTLKWFLEKRWQKVARTGLQVQRDGIVDLRHDPARREELAQLLSAVSADHVLMENMVSGTH
jgi:hypothetical protein